MKSLRNQTLALLAVLVLLSGCSGTLPTVTTAPTPTLGPTPTTTATTPTTAPTGGPTAGPTASPAPTATRGPTPTSAPTPTPVYPLLPAWAMDCIGIGFEYGSFAYLFSQDDSTYLGEAPLTDVRLSDGRHVSFEYSTTTAVPILMRYQIDGSPAKTATPDPKPVTDYRIEKGGNGIGLGTDIRTADITAAFGTPLDDVTVDTYDDGLDYAVDGYHRVFARTLRYPGLSIVLHQSPTATDKTLWRVVRLESTSADYATPRGLATGLSVRNVLDLYGTGTFGIFAYGYAHGPSGLLRLFIDPIQTTDPSQVIMLELKDGKVSRISMWTVISSGGGD